MSNRHSTPVSLPLSSVDLESIGSSTYIDRPTLPPFQVDYLSHTFSEEDVAASWKVMTKQKKALVNGIRLENASWRTWWKRKNNLATVSPDTLNWLKDSDVTWLYGPLHSTNPWTYKPKVSSTSDKLGLMGLTTSPPLSPSTLKPALKKRTMSEILRSNPIPDFKQPTTQKPPLQKFLSDPAVRTKSTSMASKDVLEEHRHPRLRFNDEVEQCIAVSDDDIVAEEEEESSDDGAIIFHVQKPSTRSILKLQSTRLKTPENKRPRERRHSYNPHITNNYSWASWDIAAEELFGDDDEDRTIDPDDYFSYDLHGQYISRRGDMEGNNGAGSSAPTSTEASAGRTGSRFGNNIHPSQDDDDTSGVVSHLVTGVKDTVNWWSSLIFGNVL